MLESLKHEDLQFQELSPEEKQSRGILARLSGPIASFTKGTRNGRKYSDKLWEKAFDAPLVKEMFKNGGLPGELQHPENRSETDPTKIAIMMPEPPKKDSKGHLVASVDILDTPCGQIAYQLGKYGFKFGISSRGEGDLIQDFSGEESVDPDTYTLNAFDLVLIPACEDARLQFNESLNTKSNNKLKTILSEALENATDTDRKIMEEVLDELNIDDNWRFIETYNDQDIYYDPDIKKYIVGDLDSQTVLNSVKNAKQYIDRYLVEDSNEPEVFVVEFVYDTYNEMTDTSDNNLVGHVKVHASSESEALQKAKKYLSSRGYYNAENIRHLKISNDNYSNIPLVEEQVGREETKPTEKPSEILKNKEDTRDEEDIATTETQSDQQNNNTIQSNEEDEETVEEALEDEEPERESWDTDFHRLDVAYNHNFKQFDDREKQSGMIRDFTDDLEAQGKKYDIYDHTSDPGCTIFFQESLKESCDGWIAFYNGKKIEIKKGEADNLYDAKLKAINELKVPKSKMGLFTIKPAYNESLNEAYEGDIKYIDVETINPTKKDIDRAEGLQYSGGTFRGDGKPFGSEASKMAKLIKDPIKLVRRSKAVAARYGADEGYDSNTGFYHHVEADKDTDVWGPFKRRLIEFGFTPEQISIISNFKLNESLNEDISWEELNGTEQSAVEAALANIKNGSTLEDAVHGAVTMYNEANSEEEYEDEDFFMEEADYTKVLDYVKEHENMGSINEEKYTRDELFDKFGTDNLDIINAGNEEEVELAGDNDMAIVEQLQNILKLNKTLEEKVKSLQEKLSVGYAKEMELKEDLDTYKQKVTKLSKKTKEVQVLTEKLAKAEKMLKDNRAQAEGRISTLNESIQSKGSENDDLKKDISNLNEAIDKKNSKIRSLNEQIREYKDQLSSKEDDIKQLEEKYENGQKDLEQVRENYSKKLEQQNQIIEKYRRVAKNSVKRYVESQAIRLGVKPDEIVNRLPKSYSFNDIDKICEDLQEYKFNMSNLPFSSQVLNENIKINAKNINNGLVEANPEDEITDYDLKVAEAFIR